MTRWLRRAQYFFTSLFFWWNSIPSGEQIAGTSERITKAAATSLLPSSDSNRCFPDWTAGLQVNLGLSWGSCLTRIQTHNSSVAKTNDFPGTNPPVSLPSPNSGNVSFSAAPSSTKTKRRNKAKICRLYLPKTLHLKIVPSWSDNLYTHVHGCVVRVLLASTHPSA